MRNPTPFFRKFDGWWYVQVRTGDGRRQQIKLAYGRENKAEAYQHFYDLMSQQDPATIADRKQLNVASLCDAFLDVSATHHAPATYQNYRHFLERFAVIHGSLRVAELKPFHVSKWLDSQPWSDATRRGAIIAIKRVFSWAYQEGYIDTLPLRTLQRPRPTPRTALVSDEDHRRMLDASEADFRVFLTALKETGARPGEIAAVTAADVDLTQRLWVLKRHKTARRTGRPRIVYLTGQMFELTKQLMNRQSEGPLFRNSEGQPWTRNAIRLRMQRLRKKLSLPKEIVAYTYRHTFATNGLMRGVPIATVAELLGHADTDMISAHYGHLGKHVDYLRQSAEQVTG